jgi:hypothetical protein
MKRKRYLPAILLLVFTVATLHATLPLSELSAERYLQHVSFLASDQLKGRGNGSPELERAAEYIAAQFRSYGWSRQGTRVPIFRSSTLR